LIEKTPLVARELTTVGGQFGQSVGRDVEQRMKDELWKKGVDL